VKHVLSISVVFFLLATASTAFALNPSRTYKQLPDKYNMKYEAHTVTTSDGAKLHAWSIKSKTKSSKYILISHNGEGNMGDYLRRVDQFTSIGYNVVTFDYRGYGKSSSFKIDRKMQIYPHFQDDFKAMVDFTRKLSPTFDAYGWGIGGGLALGVGWNRREIRKIIADTPFLSMEDLESRFAPSGKNPSKVTAAGYKKANEPVHALAKPPAGTKSVKILVGSKDAKYKKADMQKIASKKSKNASVSVIKGGDGKDNSKSSSYFTTIKTFLGAK